MKLNWFTLFFISTIFFSCENKRYQKPNIIIILTDDQGWGDLSLHGNSNIRTPNLDQIANNGVRFNRFYVSPVCSPTRAELLTGNFFFRSGVNGVTKGHERINLDHQLVSDFFKNKNYRTGLALENVGY